MNFCASNTANPLTKGLIERVHTTTLTDLDSEHEPN